jgi:hypothetical protein
MRKLPMRWKKPAPPELLAAGGGVAAAGASVARVRRHVRWNVLVAACVVVTVVGRHYRAKCSATSTVQIKVQE